MLRFGFRPPMAAAVRSGASAAVTLTLCSVRWIERRVRSLETEGIRLPRRRLGTDGLQAVDVFMEIGADGMPHRVEDEVDAFPAGELG